MLTTVLLWAAIGVNVALALITAAHAVMYKREPRAASGWVLASFALPFLGSVLYWLMGINRIHRRPMDELFAAGPPAEPGKKEAAEVEARLRQIKARDFIDLVRLARRITGQPLLAGNRLEPLVNGEEAYPAMVRAIEGARRSVTLSSYIFDGDSTGREFVRALAAAVGRGAEVRVLIDEFGEKYSRVRARSLLTAAGVRCAKFVPPIPRWRGAYINLHNHRKLLVVDGKEGFTGGMNISDRHLAARVENPRRVRDAHFRVSGPVVAELQKVFLDDWWYVTGEKLEGEAYLPPLEHAGEALCRGVTDGPDEDLERLRYIFLGAVACARERVQIRTPYFIPDRAIITGLVTAALRGVEVDIILPELNNIPPVQWATTAYLWELLRFGVRVFLDPGPFTHAKGMVVDRTWSFIGSANLDPRSFRLNFEFNLEVYDRELAEKIAEHCDVIIARSHEVTQAEVDGRKLAVRLRDGVAKLFSPYL